MKCGVVESGVLLVIAWLFGCSAVEERVADSQPPPSASRAETKETPFKKKLGSPGRKINPIEYSAQRRPEVLVSSLVEGSTTRDEIMSSLGPPKAYEGDRLIYEIWRDQNRKWRVGGSRPAFHAQYSEWD